MFWMYLIMALLWGWFAVIMQTQVKPDTDDRKLQFTFAVNAVGGPIAVFVAIVQHLRGVYVMTKGEK